MHQNLLILKLGHLNLFRIGSLELRNEPPRRAPSLRPPPKAMAAGGSYGASDKQRGIKMDYLFYFAPRGGEYNP